MHVTANSKEVREGSIFFALKGAKFDGHQFIDEALQKGAIRVYSEDPHPSPKVEVLGPLARKKLGEFASEMYGNPTASLLMIGVTGTSGKTTTTYLIHHLLETLGVPTARLGTNGTFFKGTESETSNTTPDALTLQKWFREVLDAGAKAVVMETSSHALHQDRVAGIRWNAAAFLNLSSEHRDYHHTMEDYYQAKALLFTDHQLYSKGSGKTPILFSHADHEYGSRISSEVGVASFSVQKQIRNLHSTECGIEGDVFLKGQWLPFQCPLFGSFQTENLLAALSVVVGLGHDPLQVLEALKSFTGVPGRMERIPNSQGILVFVDYAHKSEALEKVLLSVAMNEESKKLGHRLILVFGCGGDRDKTKRPAMGKIGTELADFVYLTSDNPRTEDPLQILKEIEAGISKSNYQMIPDRRTAIQTAIHAAKAGDIVMIAGKGHEDYQIIGTQKNHFDDREEAKLALGL